jgi:hypothetical protein
MEPLKGSSEQQEEHPDAFWAFSDFVLGGDARATTVTGPMEDEVAQLMHPCELSLFPSKPALCPAEAWLAAMLRQLEALKDRLSDVDLD